jgi:hypothetical protein
MLQSTQFPLKAVYGLLQLVHELAWLVQAAQLEVLQKLHVPPKALTE